MSRALRLAAVALLALAGPAAAAQLGEPGAAAAVLARTPAELPRAAPDRWKGAFEPAAEGDPRRPIAPAAIARVQAAEEAYRRADYPAALVQLFAGLELEPDLPPALLVLGTTYFRLRRYGDVALSLERFLEVAPSQVWRTQALGHAYYSLGRYETARDHYRRVLAGLPDSPEALRGLALAHYRLGESETALELLARVVALRPDHAEAHAWRAQVLFDEGRTEEALEPAERARELDPYVPRPWFLLAQIHHELGRDEEARAVEARWREVDRLAQELRTVQGQLLYFPGSLELARREVELQRELGDQRGVLAAAPRALRNAPPPEAELELRIWALDAAEALGEADLARQLATALAARCGEDPAAKQRLAEYHRGAPDRETRSR